MELPNWGTAVGAVFNKVTQFIKGPVESAKNEKVRLLNERTMLRSKEISPSGSRRIIVIDLRIAELNAKLENNAKD